MNPHMVNLKTQAHLRNSRGDWYRIRNAVGGGPAEVLIYDEIGWFGVSADDFVRDLQRLDVGEMTVRLNSPGGGVFDGIAIHNALRQHRAQVTVHVDSLAASIASVIAMAGDRLIMQPHSQLMIHDASGLCIGNGTEMRALADLLDKQSDNIAAVYAERAGGTVAEWRERMRDETWYLAEEAVEAGLADEVAPYRSRDDEDEGKVDPEADRLAARWDLSVFRYAGREQAPAPAAGPAGDEVPVAGPGRTDVEATAVGPHGGTAKEGDWSRSQNEKRLPDPVPVATAKKFYAAYDADKVEDGKIPKSAGHLPHHFVSEDGTPGAPSRNGVQNALARLNQTHGLSDEEKATVERHLRSHLPKDAEDHADPPAGPAPADASATSPAADPDPAGAPTPDPPSAPKVDDWSTTVAHLTDPDTSTSDEDEFTRLVEAL